MKRGKNRKGFAISMIIVVVISVVLIGAIWYAGQAVAGGIMQEVSDTVMGMMGKKNIVIRDKDTLIGVLKCYTALKMNGHGLKIEEISFPRLKGTKFEGCVAMGSGPNKIDFELDLENGEYIELGNKSDCKNCEGEEGDEIGRLYIDSFNKGIHIFGPEGRGKDQTGPKKWWTVQGTNKYTYCASLELAIANGEVVYTSNDEYTFCSTGENLPIIGTNGVRRNTVRVYDKAKGYIKGYYECDKFGFKILPDFMENCHGTFNIVIQEKGIGEYEVEDDKFIELLTGLPNGRVVEVEEK